MPESMMRPDFVSQLKPGIVIIVRFSKRVPNPSGNYITKIRIIKMRFSTISSQSILFAYLHIHSFG